MYDAIKPLLCKHIVVQAFDPASIKKSFQADINKSKKYVISGLEKDT